MNLLPKLAQAEIDFKHYARMINLRIDQEDPTGVKFYRELTKDVASDLSKEQLTQLIKFVHPSLRHDLLAAKTS